MVVLLTLPAYGFMGGKFKDEVKKENGAALSFPSESCVVIQAMGRGVTKEARMRYRSEGLRARRSKVMTRSLGWVGLQGQVFLDGTGGIIGTHEGFADEDGGGSGVEGALSVGGTF